MERFGRVGLGERLASEVQMLRVKYWPPLTLGAHRLRFLRPTPIVRRLVYSRRN